MIQVLFVCLGNICRSPLAEGIFRKKISDLKLPISWDSAGTNSYHIGELPDHRSRKVAQQNGINLTHHARQLEKDDFAQFDYIIGMDKNNMHDILAMQKKQIQGTAQIFLMRSFENTHLDVKDPYYGDFSGFEECYQVLDNAIDAFINFLKTTHKIQ